MQRSRAQQHTHATARMICEKDEIVFYSILLKLTLLKSRGVICGCSGGILIVEQLLHSSDEDDTAALHCARLASFEI